MLNDGKVLIAGACYVPLRTAKALTGFSGSYIQKLYQSGKIRRVKRGLGGTHLYRLDDVENYIGIVENEEDYEI